MSLEEVNEHNLSIMINGLAEHLKVINRAIFDPEHYRIEDYNQIKSLYDMVKNKSNLSVSEIHAIIDELRKFRKDN